MVAADDLKVHAERERGDRRAIVLGGCSASRPRGCDVVDGEQSRHRYRRGHLTSFLHRLSPRASYLAPFILAPVSLLLGESIPKMAVLRAPLRFARIAARPLSMLATVLTPLLAAETALSRQLRRLAGVPPEAETVFLSREDLALLIRREPQNPPAQRSHRAT